MLEATVANGAREEIGLLCKTLSESADNPQVVLISSDRCVNKLLAIRLLFLETGQTLDCPGLPLIGAAFNPTWGFAEAASVQEPGDSRFEAPLNRNDLGEVGDVHGFRFCPISEDEIPTVISQLKQIKAALR